MCYYEFITHSIITTNIRCNPIYAKISEKIFKARQKYFIFRLFSLCNRRYSLIGDNSGACLLLCIYQS